MTIDPDRAALELALAGRGAHELSPFDPALADAAAFCAALEGVEIVEGLTRSAGP